MSRARIVRAIGRSLKRAPKKKRVPKMSRAKQARVAKRQDHISRVGRAEANRMQRRAAAGAGRIRPAYGQVPPKAGSVEKMKLDMVHAIHSGFARAYQAPSARLQRGAKAYANRQVRRGMERDSIYRRRGSSDAHLKSRLMPRQVQHISHPNSPNTFTRAYNMAMKNPRFFREPLPRPRAPKRRGRR